MGLRELTFATSLTLLHLNYFETGSKVTNEGLIGLKTVLPTLKHLLLQSREVAQVWNVSVSDFPDEFHDFFKKVQKSETRTEDEVIHN